jgi:hypothetical protein
MSETRFGIAGERTRNRRAGRRGAPLGAALVASIAAIATAPPVAAGICIQPPLRVRHLQGAAVSRYQSGEDVLSGIQIRIERRDGTTAPLPLTTDADGRFAVASLAPGHYTLTAEAKPLDDIRLHLVVKRSRFWQGRDKREVVLVFGFDPHAPCRGSTVEVRKRASPGTGR